MWGALRETFILFRRRGLSAPHKAAPTPGSFRTEQADVFSCDFAPAKSSASAVRNLSGLGSCVTAGRLKMPAQFAERRQDHQLAGTGHDRFMFQVPRVLVRDVHGVQPDLHRGIDIASRAVPDPPPFRLHYLVLMHQRAVSLR